FDLTTGKNIEKALGNLSGTSTSYLKSNRNQKNQSSIKTIPRISNWFEWSWPIEELVQSEPTVGEHLEVSSK
ncbi:28636_t:CDS:2, partial [Racocetra persica]